MRSVNLAQDRSAMWELLGGARFGLAAIVMIGHLKPFETLPAILQHINQCSPVTAVFCFLVISGYSIAHSIERGDVGFYRRRLLRIYPLYLLGILVSVAVTRLPNAQHSASVPNVVANLFFLQTFSAIPLPCNAVGWSLAVEVGFYALAPLFRKMQTSMLIVLAAISAVAYLQFPYDGLGYYASLLHGEAMLFLGWCWLSGFIYYRLQSSPLAGIVLICSVICLTSLNALFTGSLQHVTVALSLGALAGGRYINLVAWTRKLLAYLGDLSFPLYLIHVPIYCLCIDTLHWRSPIVVVPMALAAAAICVALEPKLRGAFSQALDLAGALEARIAAPARLVVRAVTATAIDAIALPRARGIRAVLRPISLMIAPLTYIALAVSADHSPHQERVSGGAANVVRQER